MNEQMKNVMSELSRLLDDWSDSPVVYVPRKTLQKMLQTLNNCDNRQVVESNSARIRAALEKLLSAVQRLMDRGESPTYPFPGSLIGARNSAILALAAPHRRCDVFKSPRDIVYADRPGPPLRSPLSTKEDVLEFLDWFCGEEAPAEQEARENRQKEATEDQK